VLAVIAEACALDIPVLEVLAVIADACPLVIVVVLPALALPEPVPITNTVFAVFATIADA
tara:strand:- start:79 stop:258 length:180 start_codon:yes stop_codon:yes gene_type:complete